MKNALAVAGSLLLFLSIPSFGGTGGGNSPAAVAPGAPAMAAAGPVVSPAPAPSDPPQSPPPPAVPAQGAAPSRIPAASAAPSASFVAPPSEKASDRVLSPGEVEMQVTKNLEDVPESDEEDGLGEEFFTNASREVEKGEDGVFSGITNPIEKFIRYFQTRGRKKFELYLSRSGKYVGMMQKILVRYGLPEDLVYVALIESGFSPKAYSVAKAAGPWQFISGTGRRSR